MSGSFYGDEKSRQGDWKNTRNSKTKNVPDKLKTLNREIAVVSFTLIGFDLFVRTIIFCVNTLKTQTRIRTLRGIARRPSGTLPTALAVLAY